jgi:hypothetical protein
MASNIDPTLLSKLDEGTMQIVDKPISKKKKGKAEKVERPRCCAAVRIPTIGKAYLALDTKEKDGSSVLVYIEKTPVDGEMKESSYRCCTKTISGETNFCHMHLKKHSVNASDIRIFTTDFIEKASDDADSEIRQAKPEDSYFEKMDKERGSRPRTDKGHYKLDKNHPFRRALDSKDARVLTKAMRAVQEILRQDAESRGKRYVVESESDSASDSEEEEEEAPAPKKKSSKSAEAPKAKATKKPMKSRSTHASDSEEEAAAPKKKGSKKPVDFGSDSEEEVEEEVLPPSIAHLFPNEDEDDGEDYEQIKTTTGKKLYYFPDSKMLYAPVAGSDESEPVGKMIPMEKSHAHILYKGQYYTALSKVHMNGTDFLTCELDNKVFDFHSRHIGTLTKKGKKFEIITN